MRPGTVPLPRCPLAVAAGVLTFLAACGSPTGITGLFLRVGGEYDLTAVFTTTYDCDPHGTAPRDTLICAPDTGVVTTQLDTLRAQLAIDAFCDTASCLLGLDVVGTFTASASATWSSHHLRPLSPATVNEYPDLTVQIKPLVLDCSMERRRGFGRNALCVGHETETFVIVGVLLDSLGVWLGNGLPEGNRITGDVSNLAGTMEPRSFMGTIWTLR